MSDTKRSRSLSEALNTSVRKYGTSIVSNIAIAVRTTQLYSFEHQNVTQALRELAEIVKSFIELEHEAELSRVEEFLFINEIRIKVDLGGMKTYDAVLQILQEREIGAITFTAVPSETELKQLIDLLATPVGNPEQPWQWFSGALNNVELPTIRVSRYEVVQDQQLQVTDDKRTLAINLFFRTIQQVQDSLDNARAGRKINFKRLKRSVQAIVDTVLEDQPTLLALVNIKDYRTRLANHSVNCAVLATALGARLGFSKKLLGDLGVAALMHDLGSVAMDPELASREHEPASEEERRAVEDHVYRGVDVLINQRIADTVVKSMNVAFLHHFRFDGTGYPRTFAIKSQNFYSRIVAVCDGYDSLTASGPDGRPRCTPDKLMRRLLEGSGTEFDPLIVKAFVNLMGLYPVGCVVCLDDGSVATVVSPSSDPKHLDRPTVRIFADAGGGPADRTLDLLQRGPGGFERSILKLFQEAEVGLQMEEYLSVI